MGVAFEEVGCEGALGQQCIGGEGLAADVFELVEERNDGADLVGALGLVVVAGLEADFLCFMGSSPERGETIRYPVWFQDRMGVSTRSIP